MIINRILKNSICIQLMSLDSKIGYQFDKMWNVRLDPIGSR